jgi:hypothetical protein
MKGIHARRLTDMMDDELVGPGGVIPGSTLRADTVTVNGRRSFHYTEQPVLGVVLPDGGGALHWDGGSAALPVWCFFYVPRDCPFTIEAEADRPLAALLVMPVRADDARWESSTEGEPVVVRLEELWAVEKEGRVCYNAAGRGFPIDRPYFMGSYCVYDLKYGEMPQHVHEDQEEFMVILRAAGTHSTFLIGEHSYTLEDWTMIHVFQNFWHGYAPAKDGSITIIALYLDPVPGGCVDAVPIAEADLAYWQRACEGLSAFLSEA